MNEESVTYEYFTPDGEIATMTCHYGGDCSPDTPVTTVIPETTTTEVQMSTVSTSPHPDTLPVTGVGTSSIIAVGAVLIAAGFAALIFKRNAA